MKGKNLSRRSFLGSAAAMAAMFASSAAAHEDPPFEMPVDYLPTLIDMQVPLPPGMIHVFPNQFRLFLTLPDNQALRYTVGVGRPGLYHAGRFTVGAKREWPSWKPTPAMIRRNPDAYARYADGVPGGVDNPLGARRCICSTMAAMTPRCASMAQISQEQLVPRFLTVVHG